jgi:hypothetical protein
VTFSPYIAFINLAFYFCLSEVESLEQLSRQIWAHSESRASGRFYAFGKTRKTGGFKRDHLEEDFGENFFDSPA